MVKLLLRKCLSIPIGGQTRSNMQIELNEQECHNIKVALRVLIKQPEANEETMKTLLILSDKFSPRQPKRVKDKK